MILNQALVRAIERADSGQHVQRYFFDLVTVTSGTWIGLRAVGVGSTVEKRKRAAKIALAAAAIHESRFSTLQLAESKRQGLLSCINIEKVSNTNHPATQVEDRAGISGVI